MNSITLETLEELEQAFSDLVEDAFLLECIESWQRAGHLAPGDFSPQLTSNCRQRVLQYMKQHTDEVARYVTKIEKQYKLPPEERKPAPELFPRSPAELLI